MKINVSVSNYEDEDDALLAKYKKKIPVLEDLVEGSEEIDISEGTNILSGELSYNKFKTNRVKL